MHQRNYTRNAVEENRTAKRVEKTLYKNKKEKYTKDKLKKLEHLRHRNKRKVFFCQNLTRSRKGFKPKITLPRHKKIGETLSKKDDNQATERILRNC